MKPFPFLETLCIVSVVITTAILFLYIAIKYIGKKEDQKATKFTIAFAFFATIVAFFITAGISYTSYLIYTGRFIVKDDSGIDKIYVNDSTFLVPKLSTIEESTHSEGISFNVVNFYKTSLILTFSDNTKDTLKLNIYDNPKNFTLKDGNLSYVEAIDLGSQGVGYMKTSIASFVKTVHINDYEESRFSK